MFECCIPSHISYIDSCVESEVMQHIKRLFVACKPIEQYPIGPYRIDMYLEKGNIALECDEHNHHSRNKTKEVNRQLYIEKQLKCRFVRFDPDVEGVDVMSVIGEVVLLLMEGKTSL